MWWNLVSQTLVVLVVLLGVKYLLRRPSLPPGPFPLPFVGNLLMFRGGTYMRTLLDGFRSKYGDVFTFWMGNRPMVHICGWKLIKEVLQNKDFSGRTHFPVFHEILQGGLNIAMVDPSPKWNILRKIGFAATRKYASSPCFDEMLLSLVDEEIDDTLKEETIDLKDRIDFLVFCITNSSTFGKRCSRSDLSFVELKREYDKVLALFHKVMVVDLISILKPFLGWTKKRLLQRMLEMESQYIHLFEEHYKDYDGSIKDFMDAVVSARQEADPNDPGFKEMKDRDFMNLVFDLFSAGYDTMRATLQWALLHMAAYQDVQEKAAKEIADNIGDKMPVPEDRTKCPYLCAFTSEVLRMRPPAAFGLTQKTICDTSIGGYKLPAGTTVTICFETPHFDESYWKEPTRFRPERFLENPNIQKSHYLPFSTGRRSCVGEKLALSQLFLILARFLQRTSITTVGEVDLMPILDVITSVPKPHRLRFKKRELV